MLMIWINSHKRIGNINYFINLIRKLLRWNQTVKCWLKSTLLVFKKFSKQTKCFICKYALQVLHENYKVVRKPIYNSLESRMIWCCISWLPKSHIASAFEFGKWWRFFFILSYHADLKKTIRNLSIFSYIFLRARKILNRFFYNKK